MSSALLNKTFLSLSLSLSRQEKTREEREAALVPKVSEALRYGLNVIDAAFEKLDSNIINSDTDDDDDDADYRVDPILEAKVSVFL